MDSFLPRTPTGQAICSQDLSPAEPLSYDSYLLHTVQRCSSPTPFPSNSRVIPCAISPHQYQLAHLDLNLFPSRSEVPHDTPSHAASFFTHSPSSPRVENGLNDLSTQVPSITASLNASNASVGGLRTLSATDTIPDVQLGSARESLSPLKFSTVFNSPHRGYKGVNDLSDRFAPARDWWSRSSSPSKPTRFSHQRTEHRGEGKHEHHHKSGKLETYRLAPSSTFTSPRSSQSTHVHKEPSFSLDEDDEHFFSSSQDTYSSSGSSRLPCSNYRRSPSLTGRFVQYTNEITPTGSEPANFSRLTPSPSKDLRYSGTVLSPPLSSLLHYGYGDETPRTPRRLAKVFGSPVFGGEYLAETPHFAFKSTPGGMCPCTPGGYDEMEVGTDVSPIIRHGEKEPVFTVDAETSVDGYQRRGASPMTPSKPSKAPRYGHDDIEDEEDQSESRLYAPSSSRSSVTSFADLLERSSSVQGDESSDDDEYLPLAASYMLSRHRRIDRSRTQNHSAKGEDSPTVVYLHQSRTNNDALPGEPFSRTCPPTPSTSTHLVKAKSHEAWNMGSPLSSPPSSVASSPRHSVNTAHHRGGNFHNYDSNIRSDTCIPEKQGSHGETPGLRVLEEFSIERPTRSRTRALTAALHHYREDDAPGHNLAEIQATARTSRSKKRKATKTCTPGDEGISSGHKPKRSKHSRRDRATSVGNADSPSRSHFGIRAQDEVMSTSQTNVEEESCDASERRDIGRRTFPAAVPIRPTFSLFYRKFPVIENKPSPSAVVGATPNAPRSVWDLYTPRWTRGRGTTKIGLCPICIEPPTRGGEGKKVWLSTKFSAFKCYHMQYAHGISPTTGLPFSPPIAFTRTDRLLQAKQGLIPKYEKTQIEEGRCHKCNKWVPVEGVKDVEVKVKEIFWWKHAATCHHGSTLVGEQDIFFEDEIYRHALAATATNQTASD